MLPVELKYLRESDLDRIMRWRMQPDVTQFMNTDPVLTPDGQREWFRRISSDPTQRHWVVHVDGNPAGVVNLFDIDRGNRRSDWGYYIAEKKARSLKLAVTLEWNLYAYAFETLGLNRLYNGVLTENRQVMKLHEMCGSRLEGTARRHVCKNGVFYDVAYYSILADEWRKMKETLHWQAIPIEEIQGGWPG